ncbi:ABC transporter substrate-binding protein [Micromonospora sp. CPCC 206060]|uniref:ABC transporter substrate-binding protein n=1 Tax=Micromonospora sp. CPCC 206060 TaxID=3122406 RepID=UPI002FF3BC90
MAKYRIAAVFATALLALSACGGGGSGDASADAGSGPPKLKQKDSYTVGFAAQQSDHPWTLALAKSIQDEAQKRGHKIVFTDAQGQTAKQVQDVESLIAQGVDAILITPREEGPLARAVIKAHDAGIPVFLIDRSVDKSVAQAGRDYVTFIGSDFVAEGRKAGEWLVKAANGKGKVLELSGTTGSSAAQDRAKGFREAVTGTELEIVATQDGDFVRDKGRQKMEAMIQQHPEATVVFAHNDEMALGAITALEAAGRHPGKDVTVVSIDGQKEALQAIIDGKLGATVECNPRFGPKAFDAIEAYGRGEKVETTMVNDDAFFDASNAAAALPNAY